MNAHDNQGYIDHEVRIRMLENLAIETKKDMTEIRQEIKEFRKDLHSQFKWIMGSIGGFFSSILIAIIVAIILKVFHLG